MEGSGKVSPPTGIERITRSHQLRVLQKALRGKQRVLLKQVARKQFDDEQ